MRLFNIHGRLTNKLVHKFKIKWESESRSNIQYKVKQFLYPYWSTHMVYEEFPVFGSKLKVDFINFTLKVAIEVQGNQHNTFNKFFHGNRAKFQQSIHRDYTKFEWLSNNSIQLIEILENEVPNLSISYFKEKFNLNLL